MARVARGQCNRRAVVSRMILPSSENEHFCIQLMKPAEIERRRGNLTRITQRYEWLCNIVLIFEVRINRIAAKQSPRAGWVKELKQANSNRDTLRGSVYRLDVVNLIFLAGFIIAARIAFYQ